MKNVLQEQLLKAGLATEQQINKANTPVRRPRKPKHKPKAHSYSKARKKPNDDGSDLKAAFAARRREEQREAAEKKADAQRRKANKQRVNELIKKNALSTKGGEIEHQFVVGSSIKKIWVTEAQKTALLTGDLAVTFLGGKRCLIPKEVVEEILKLDPKKIMSFSPTGADKSDGEFDVPDDLVW